MATKASTLVKEARTRAGLTQRTLAERAGVRQPVIAAYETGRRQPSLPTLRKLLRAAGFELETSLRAARPGPDVERAGRVLPMVLELAGALPKRRRPERLDFPRLPTA